MTGDREELSFLLQGCLEELFVALKIELEGFFKNDNELRGTCPCHQSDNRTAFTYYFKNGLWFCWTENCHKEKGADLIGLIALKTGSDVSGACEWAKNFLKSKNVTTRDVAVKLRGMKKEAKKANYWKEHLVQQPFSDSVLSRLDSPAMFARRRGFDLDVLRGMGAGYAVRGRMHYRIVFPVRNVSGKIVGFTGRLCALKPEKLPKWRHWPRERFRTTINLFNIDKAAKHIRRTGAVIIGEGPLEVVKLEMAGYRNSVSVFGLRVTEGHVDILKKCGAIYTVLVFDPDRVESSAVKDNISRLQANDFDVRVLRWDGNEDIGAMDLKKVHRVISQASDVPTFHEWRNR